jgi:hypothetical protein
MEIEKNIYSHTLCRVVETPDTDSVAHNSISSPSNCQCIGLSNLSFHTRAIENTLVYYITLFDVQFMRRETQANVNIFSSWFKSYLFLKSSISAPTNS